MASTYKRLWLLLTGLIVLALPMAAHASAAEPGGIKPKTGGILIQACDKEPPSLDPQQEGTIYMLIYVASQYNGLLQFDPLDNTKIVGDLAKSWKFSGDGRTITFKLHEGVKWHDGKPFTAEDVLYTLRRTKDPPKGITSPRKIQFASIEKMEAPDANTFVLTTKVPNPSILGVLAQGWTVILPKHVMEAKGGMKKDVVGTGPFKFKKYIRGTSYEVVKNPDYFIKGRPYLDGIKWYVVPDMSAYVVAFKTHQINLLAGIPNIYKSHVEEIKAAVKGVQVQTEQLVVQNVLWMNTEKKPWDDIRVRKAAWLAVDRQAANTVLAEGDGSHGLMLAPEGKWGLPTAEIMKLPGYRQPKGEDLAEAKKLMAEAGYAAGVDVVMDSRVGDTDERRATFLKDQLGKIGIRAKIQLNELAKMYQIINAYTYNCVAYPNALAIDDPDDCFSRYWLPGALWNRARLKDPKLDEMHAKQSQTVDVAQRKKLVRELEDYVIAQYPAVVLYWTTQYGCAWPEVKNWKLGYGIYNNLKYQDVWLDQ